MDEPVSGQALSQFGRSSLNLDVEAETNRIVEFLFQNVHHNSTGKEQLLASVEASTLRLCWLFA